MGATDRGADGMRGGLWGLLKHHQAASKYLTQDSVAVTSWTEAEVSFLLAIECEELIDATSGAFLMGSLKF